MIALLGALLAGALTTLAPCVLPLLPVVLGGSLADSGGRSAFRRAGVITAALGASVITFTLLLKASTALIDVPRLTWQLLSGGVLIGLGLASLLPGLWERVSVLWQARAASGLASAHRRGGLLGLVLTGAALGPVFSSCSPLYAYVVVTVFPASPGRALLLLSGYVVGLCGVLLLVASLGQRAVRGARWASDPRGWFRRGLGVLFIAVGLLVITGADRELQAWLIENAPIAPWNLDRGFIPE
jgi:cytochrome c biogenesis protein CcdA